MSESVSSLHLTNLANVAYGYAGLLRKADEEAFVRCHDLRHLMSQPEWEDLELDGDDFPDENEFWSNTADFGEYRRPEWFVSVGIMPDQVGTASAPTAPSVATRTAQAAWRRLPMRARRPMKSTLRRLQYRRSARQVPVTHRPPVETFDQIIRARVPEVVERSRQLDPAFHLDAAMASSFVPHACWVRRFNEQLDIDVDFAYVLAPIYAMLANDVPSIAVEIGTMREIPFDGSDTGRLLANAYRFSDHVIITNPDVVTQAKRLEVPSYSFVPHPLDEERYESEADPAFGAELRAKHQARFVIFAPARQNWAIKGNDRFLRGFASVLAERAERDVVLIVPAWGQEIARSQRLATDLGIADRVVWIRPQSEAALRRYYQAADIVLDQFVLGVFGLTTPKAMASGAAVITSYDPDIHRWAFPQAPPLVPASAPDEIAAAMRSLLDDPTRLASIGAASRRWVEEYHSASVIVKGLDEAAGIAAERFAARRAQVGAGGSA